MFIKKSAFDASSRQIHFKVTRV